MFPDPKFDLGEMVVISNSIYSDLIGNTFKVIGRGLSADYCYWIYVINVPHDKDPNRSCNAGYLKTNMFWPDTVSVLPEIDNPNRYAIREDYLSKSNIVFCGDDCAGLDLL